jgi:hypothetical protein
MHFLVCRAILGVCGFKVAGQIGSVSILASTVPLGYVGSVWDNKIAHTDAHMHKVTATKIATGLIFPVHWLHVEQAAGVPGIMRMSHVPR